jgi:cell division protein FtsB
MNARRQGASSSGTRRPVASGAGRRPNTSSSSAASRRTAGATGASRPDPQRASRAAAQPSRPTDTGSGGPVWGLTKRTLVLTVLVVLAIASVLPYLNAWIRQQQELSRLRDQVSAQEQVVTDLEVEVNRWEDPAYVMAQARDRLLYALPGETQYRLTDTSGRDVPLSADSLESESVVTQDWFSSLWTSVQAADEAAPDVAVSTAPTPPADEPVAPGTSAPTDDATGGDAPGGDEAPDPDEETQ